MSEIKKGDKVRLLRDNDDPRYGKKGEVGTVTSGSEEGVNIVIVDGIGGCGQSWLVPLTYLELVVDQPSPTTLAQAHDAGLLTAWLGEAPGPCVPCDDEALVVRGRYSGLISMCAVGGNPSDARVKTRSAVKDGGWRLYWPQHLKPFQENATETQALAWCARGVRP